MRACGAVMAVDKVDNFIQGTWRTAASSDWFESRNPANPDDVIGLFPQSITEDIDAAVLGATRSFSAWRGLGLVKRAEYLLRVAQLMEEDREPLARLVAREAGKQINEARADVVEAIHTAQYAFAYGH